MRTSHEFCSIHRGPFQDNPGRCVCLVVGWGDCGLLACRRTVPAGHLSAHSDHRRCGRPPSTSSGQSAISQEYPCAWARRTTTSSIGREYPVVLPRWSPRDRRPHLAALATAAREGQVKAKDSHAGNRARPAGAPSSTARRCQSGGKPGSRLVRGRLGLFVRSAAILLAGQTKGEYFVISCSFDISVTRSPVEGAVDNRWPIDY